MTAQTHKKNESASEVNQIMLSTLMSVVHSRYFCTMFYKLQMIYCSSNLPWVHEISLLNVKARLTQEEQTTLRNINIQHTNLYKP